MPHFDSDALYLTCFSVGLVLSLLSLAGGREIVRANSPGRRPAMGGLSSRAGFPVVSCLCWFGGTGYLLSHGHVLGWVAVLAFAALSGVAGSSLVFWLTRSDLWRRKDLSEPAGAAMIGVLGRVSTAIPTGGLGEMLYTQNGARRSVPIAAEDGAPIDREAEVVVLHYARGVAYVRRWDEMQAVLLGDEPAAHSNDI